MRKIVLIVVWLCLYVAANAQTGRKALRTTNKQTIKRLALKQTNKKIVLSRIVLSNHATIGAAAKQVNTDDVFKLIRSASQRTQVYDVCPRDITPHDPYIAKQFRRKTFEREQLVHLAIRDVNDALSLVAGVYQRKRGEPLHVDGGRSDGNLYIVDGMYILKN